MVAQTPVNYYGKYQTDLIQEKATALLEKALASPDTPFFVGIAPTAPHMEVQADSRFTEPLPAPKYAGLFNETIVPRTPSYNVQGGVSWIKNLPELNQTLLDYVCHLTLPWTQSCLILCDR